MPRWVLFLLFTLLLQLLQLKKKNKKKKNEEAAAAASNYRLVCNSHHNNPYHLEAMSQAPRIMIKAQKLGIWKTTIHSGFLFAF